MEIPDKSQRARDIISEIIYINIATVTDDGKPWNTPVYFAFDESYNFYWASWKENEHSKHIRKNPDIFITIYDSKAQEGTGEGLYIQAKALELETEEDIKHAIKYCYGRKNSKPRSSEEFTGDYPRRMYKAIPQKCWMNGDGNIKGNYIDVRIEVKL